MGRNGREKKREDKYYKEEVFLLVSRLDQEEAEKEKKEKLEWKERILCSR